MRPSATQIIKGIKWSFETQIAPRLDDKQSQSMARSILSLLDHLYVHVPRVRGKVDYSELSSPLSTRHFSGHPHGEMYGLSPTPARFRTRLRAQTAVRGVFLTGQDLVMAGVVGAMFGGVLAASAVLRRNVLKEILR